MEVSAKASDVFTAKASMLGFVYQLRFALAGALKRGWELPGLQVGVEILDDVDFSAGGTPLELVQSKHRINNVADLQDASPALWKTLRGWCVRIANGMNPGRITLTLVTTGIVPAESAAAKLRPQGRDEQKALQTLERVAESSRNEATAAARTAFLELEPELRKKLVGRIQVLDAAATLPDLAEAIEREVRRSCLETQTAAFREHLEGWWFDRCIQELSSLNPEPVPLSEIEGCIDRLRTQFRDDNLPYAKWDDASDAIIDDYEERLFVRQLRDIGIADSDTLLRAIRDYLRAFSHRSRWTRGGIADLQELQVYDHRLREEWEIHFSAMKRRLGSEAAEERKQELAQELFNWMEQEADLAPRPQFQHRFITRGSYHGMADEPIVGWHGDFVERYGEEGIIEEAG